MAATALILNLTAAAQALEIHESTDEEPAATDPIALIVCHPPDVTDYVGSLSDFFATPTAGRTAARRVGPADGAIGGKRRVPLRPGPTEARHVCDLYDRAGLERLVDADVHGVRFASLEDALSSSQAQGAHRYVYFQGPADAASASPMDLAMLRAAFDADAPVGVGGAAEGTLPEILGLPPDHDEAELDVPAAIFFHRGQGGSIDQLHVDGTELAGFGDLMDVLLGWEERNHAHDGTASARQDLARPTASTQVDGTSWRYCKSYSYAGLVQDGSGVNRGGYNMSFEFYYAPGEETVDGKTRWLLVPTLTTSQSAYYTESKSKEKGWYVKRMALRIDLQRFIGDIAEWSPSTTVGSTTTSSTIGGSISGVTPGAAYDVSTYNSTNDVEVVANGDLTSTDGVPLGAISNDFVDWSVNFSGCQANTTSTRIKAPAAAARGVWTEGFALYTENEQAGEGIKVRIAPEFVVEHCRCGTGSCPIRKTVAYAPWGARTPTSQGDGGTGRLFTVFPESCD